MLTGSCGDKLKVLAIWLFTFRSIEGAVVMSQETSPINRKNDRWIDALATVVLVTIFVITLVYWVSSQS